MNDGSDGLNLQVMEIDDKKSVSSKRDLYFKKEIKEKNERCGSIR